MNDDLILPSNKKIGLDPKRKEAATITVVESTYFRKTTRTEPITNITRFSRQLKTKEQDYFRTLTIGEEWLRIDCGWLQNNVGMLLVTNEQGAAGDTTPTPQERSDEAAKIVELSYTRESQQSWLIYPQESMRGVPSAATDLYVRCQKGEAEVSFHLLPS